MEGTNMRTLTSSRARRKVPHSTYSILRGRCSGCDKPLNDAAAWLCQSCKAELLRPAEYAEARHAP